MSGIINFPFSAYKVLVISGLLLSGSMFSCHSEKASSETLIENGPQVLDERLQLTLFAEEPDIVTPIGIAIDSLDRIFVLESHTHQRPKDYQGPEGDRVKIFQDRDGDGKPEEVSVYAEGFREGVNIAFSPEGMLYVVTSRTVYALHDRNSEGQGIESVKVVELTEPKEVYAHAALLGVTFSADGWMYISRGNTGSSPWTMSGSDKSSVSGYGDGGNIVRARPDGSELEEVATGFWNPVDLKFDDRGRLLALDNDPDSRGPNKLVHVVPGGDYGYKSLYGGSGIHPYLAWNGELPGNLPYAVGLGEAPSGLLRAGLAALPEDYQGQMLASIWEESRVVRINLAPEGVSVTGDTKVIVEGKQEFRPVAFAADSKGTIYFTDWVLRDYSNHGRGRIWKLSARPDVAVMTPVKEYAAPLPNPEGEAQNEVFAINSPNDIERLQEALSSGDPFLQHAAAMVLSRPAFQKQVLETIRHPNPDLRLGAMLALQRSGYPHAKPILRQLLKDPDIRVRRRALMWIGQEGITDLQTELYQALATGTPSTDLFKTYLETIRHLSPAFIKAYKERSISAKNIERSLPTGFFEKFIDDQSMPASLRAMAIRNMEKPEEQVQLLTSLLSKDQNPQLRLEAILALASVPGPEIGEHLVEIAQKPANPVLIRAEAILSLSRQPGDLSEKIIPLLHDQEPDIQIEAARYLRSRLPAERVRKIFSPIQKVLKENSKDPFQQQLSLALSAAGEETRADRKLAERPSSLEEWENVLAGGGEAQRGRRVFYSLQSSCSACHAMEGRGGDLGPDLSNVGLSKSRAQLISSIIHPSREISPEYQGWYIKLLDRTLHQGRQIDVGGGDIKLLTHSAGFISVPKEDIEDYGMIESSLMPEGLEAKLTLSDLRDLIEFLEKEGLREENL